MNKTKGFTNLIHFTLTTSSITSFKSTHKFTMHGKRTKTTKTNKSLIKIKITITIPHLSGYTKTQKMPEKFLQNLAVIDFFYDIHQKYFLFTKPNKPAKSTKKISGKRYRKFPLNDKQTNRQIQIAIPRLDSKAGINHVISNPA